MMLAPDTNDVCSTMISIFKSDGRIIGNGVCRSAKVFVVERPLVEN